jgi:hypothetical protein
MKRVNRGAKVSDESKTAKKLKDQERVEKLVKFSSIAKVAELCSGMEKCCSKGCLKVSLNTI